MAKKATPRRPRDPAWRMRHALGARRIDGVKTYDRKAERDAERAAKSETAQPDTEEPDAP